MKPIKYFLILLSFALCSPDCDNTLPSGDSETITIASLNLTNFGPTKLNDLDRINVIVDVLKKYDIIAI